MTMLRLLPLLLPAFSFGPMSAASARQTDPPLRVLVGGGDVFSYGGFSWTVSSMGLEMDPLGGWVSFVNATCPDTSPTSSGFLFGVRPGGDPGDMTLLAGPVLNQGQITERIRMGTMVDGKVALLGETTSGLFASLDGTTVLTVGDVIPATAETVSRIDWVQATSTPGRAYAYCLVEDGAGEERRALLRVPGPTLLLGDGDTVPNFPTPIRRLDFDLRVGRTGDHWALKVIFDGPPSGASRLGIVADGQALDLGGGSLMVVGEPLPDYLDLPFSGGTWSQVLEHFLNDAGDWAVRGAVPFGGLLMLRNGRPIELATSFPYSNPESMGVDGFLCGHFDDEPRAESLPYVDLPAPIDRDGDGAADLGYSWPAGRFGSLGGANDAGLALFRVTIDAPGGGQPAVLLAPRYRVDSALCAGVPNSTGSQGHLGAVGRSAVGENRLTLTAWDLPTDAFGYFLLSRTPDFVPQAGGSVGNLCLGGSIGRAVNQIFQVPASGRAQIALDLTDLPQPQGGVAAQVGETWYAQAWHRDSVSGTATSNFTAAISVDFD